MKMIMDNWALIIAVIAIILAAGGCVWRFYKLPSDKQQQTVKEWLLWAVTKAETELGGGTGQLKLAMVYDLFITRFPAIAKVMSFDMFCNLVDKALDKMNEILSKNEKIADIVEKRTVL